MKKYTKVSRKMNNDFFLEGVSIIVQEKLDGANASFLVNSKGELEVFSRNNELNEENTLNGFYGWVHDNIDPTELQEGLIYFGEWLSPHKVDYGENFKKFFLFDVYNIDKEEYLDFNYVVKAARQLDLNLIPVLYQGEFKDYEHLLSFVGKTMLGGKIGEEVSGEGIVIKRNDYYDRGGNQKYFKIVTDKFSEKAKKIKVKKEQTPESKFASEYVVYARVEKKIYDLLDNGVDVSFENFGNVLKELNQIILEDVIEEEKESLPENYDKKVLSKSVSRKVASYVREFLENKEKNSFKGNELGGSN